MAVIIIKSPENQELFRKVILEAVPIETIDRVGRLIQKVYADKG